MSKKIISKKEFQEMYPRYNTESKWKTIVNRIKASEYADAYVRISRNDVNINIELFERFLELEGINWANRYGTKMTRTEFERRLAQMKRRTKKRKNIDELRDEYLEAYDEAISKTIMNIMKTGLTEHNVRILLGFMESKKDFEKRYC